MERTQSGTASCDRPPPDRLKACVARLERAGKIQCSQKEGAGWKVLRCVKDCELNTPGETVCLVCFSNLHEMCQTLAESVFCVLFSCKLGDARSLTCRHQLSAGVSFSGFVDFD